MPVFQVISPYTGLSQSPRASLQPTTAYETRRQNFAHTTNPLRAKTVPIPVHTIAQYIFHQPGINDDPPLLTPHTELHSTHEQVTNQTYADLPPILMEYQSAVQGETVDPTYHQQIPTPPEMSQPSTRHTIPETAQPEMRDINPEYQSFQSFIPSVNTVSSLKKQLNKLEVELIDKESY